jgi:hypothetical protein
MPRGRTLLVLLQQLALRSTCCRWVYGGWCGSFKALFTPRLAAVPAHIPPETSYTTAEPINYALPTHDSLLMFRFGSTVWKRYGVPVHDR